MGVHGLWQLLNPAGRPVTLESLEGKVLAVDVSLWLHQTMKGMRDKNGNPLPNAHLQGLFSRLCKLLFYRIKPVFVFDGDVPVLKKQTLIARRERKTQAEREGHEIAQKLLQNLIKSQAVKNVLSEGSNAPVKVPGVRKGPSSRVEKDVFELPPLHESEDTRLKLNAEAWEQEFEQQEIWIREGMSVFSDAKHGSKEFKMLPMEIQHEVLNDMKETQKFHSLRQMTQMPEDSDDFSAYQLKKLMKQCNLTTEIESIRKRMAKKIVNDYELETEENYTGDEVEARRIVSEDASHYILVKGMSKEKQKEQADRYALESKIKKEKEDDLADFKGALSKTSSVSERRASVAKTPTEKRSLASNKDDSSSSKKARRSRPARKYQSKATKGGAASALGITVSIHKVASESESDETSSTNADSVEEMTSEDEGFIEVAFDPMKAVEEDELFPASIFTTAVVDNQGKHDSSAEDPRSSTEDESFPPGNPSKKIMGVSIRKAKGGKTFVEREERDTEKDNDTEIDGGATDICKVTDVDDKEGSVVVSKSSDVEKRKSVLNDILSQLKQRKEEIGQLDDVEENVHGDQSAIENISSDGDEDVSAKDKLKNVETEIKLSRDLKNMTPGSSELHTTLDVDDDSINSKAHHVDSDSEDEDLKIAIELSLQTAKESYETSGKEASKAGDALDAQAPLKDRNTIGEVIREDDEVDDDDFAMVEPTSDGEITDFLIQDEDTEEECIAGEEGVDEPQRKENKSTIDSCRKQTDDLPSGTTGLSDERLQPEDFEIDTSIAFRSQDIAGDYTNDLEAERNALLLEQGKQARFATTVTEQATLEAQELLRLFGIPYIVSTMEAEAQCAYLDITGQTDGTVTDDSDIWLFGGQRMYKNFFNHNKHVQVFSDKSIVSHFRLNRQQLINIALLCGSDYTEGIEGVGPVRALEIMGEFPGDGLNGLKDFRKWWDRAKRNPLMKEMNKLRTRLRDLSVSKGFPSQAVVDAYLNPSVDESRESFTWGQPDLDLLRQFTKLKFGWSKDKADQSLVPMMKQHMKRQTQDRIYSYFQHEVLVPANIPKSNRLEKALSRFQLGKHAQAEDEQTVAEKPQQKVQKNKRNVDQPARNEQEARTEPHTANLKKRKKVEKLADKKTKQNGKEVTDTNANNAKVKKMYKSLPLEMDQEETSLLDTVTLDAQREKEHAGKPSARSAVKERKGKPRQGVTVREREHQKIPVLTLEAKRKGKKGQKAGPKQSVPCRSSVCLSESSSDSDDSGSLEEKVSVKIEKPETVQRQKVQAKNVKPIESGNKSKSDYLQTRKREVNENKSETKKAKTSHFPRPNDSSPTVRKPISSVPGKCKIDNENLHSEKLSFDSVEENLLKSQSSKSFQEHKRVKNVPSTRGDSFRAGTQKSLPESSAKRRVSEKQIDMRHEEQKSDESVKGGKECQNTSRPTAKGQIQQLDNMKDSLVSDQETSSKDEEGTENQLSPKQVNKNPDVSLINAQTLKATLTYLNQRSHEKKQLLDTLKGGHRLNAVERRMAEEEKRERMTALVHEKKEKNLSAVEEEETVETMQLVSFEDMLGGMDVEASSKRCAGKNKSRSVATSKSEKPKQKDETGERRSHSNLSSDTHSCKEQLRSDVDKAVSAPKNRKRMRSVSDDSSSSIDLTSKQEEEAETEEVRCKNVEYKVKDHRSQKSRCFDEPISGATDDQSDKFHYQIQHFQDLRSVKAHGYIPNTKSSGKLRGRAVAGKGKGIGKNRNGRKADNSERLEKSTGQICMGIQASKGVTDEQIEEYAHITTDDLGSDFSDNEF